jgi:RNA polymerase sigma-70 factor, ECF subfamily
MFTSTIASVEDLHRFESINVDDPAAVEAKLMLATRIDPQQFTPIYKRYSPRVYAYCLRRIGSVQEAEELTSITFTRALSNIAQYRGGLVSAWIFRIAHNVLYDYYNSRKSDAALDDLSEDLHAPSISPMDYVIQNEEADVLRDLVSQLPADQRDLLLYKIVDDLSSEEIGELLGKSSGAVRVTLHRIIRQLYTQYKQREGR